MTGNSSAHPVICSVCVFSKNWIFKSNGRRRGCGHRRALKCVVARDIDLVQEFSGDISTSYVD